MNNYQDNSSNNTNELNQNLFNNTVPPVNNTPVQAILGSSIPFNPMKEETTIVPNTNLSNDTYQNNITTPVNSIPTNISSPSLNPNINPFTDPNAKTYADFINKENTVPTPPFGETSNNNTNGNSNNSFNLPNTNNVNPITNINNNQTLTIDNSKDNVINPFANQNSATYVDMLRKEGINIPKTTTQSFITNTPAYNDTSIKDLNIQGNYNNPENDYRQDPQVIANLNPNKKKTVTITGELKLVIIIALILFIFILVIPFIFDFISEIKY